MIKLSDDVEFYPDEQGGYIKFNGKIWRPVEESKPFIPTIFIDKVKVDKEKTGEVEYIIFDPVFPSTTPVPLLEKYWTECAN